MTDWGKTNRTDTFEFALCDPFTLNETGPADVDARSSSISWGWYTDNLYSGTIVLTGEAGRRLGKDRLIRVKQITGVDGEKTSAVLATMFVDSVTTNVKFKRSTTRASCYSPLWRFTQDVLISDFWRGRGYNVVQAIRDLVEASGGRLRVLDGVNTQKTFGNDIWFDLNTKQMEVLGTIAGWIGCQIGCDAHGHVTIHPYVEPSDKPVRYSFRAGENCAYLPGVAEEDNRADVVNRVVAYYTRESKDEDDDFPLTDRAVAELGVENSFSFARCGRYQTKVIKVEDPCSTEELESRARAYLIENSGEIRHYTIEHVSIPGLSVGDVVTYENDTDYAEPVSARCMVVQMDMRSLSPGAKCTTKLKLIL